MCFHGIVLTLTCMYSYTSFYTSVTRLREGLITTSQYLHFLCLVNFLHLVSLHWIVLNSCYLKCTRLIFKKHIFYLLLRRGAGREKRNMNWIGWCLGKKKWCDCSFLQNFPFYVIYWFSVSWTPLFLLPYHFLLTSVTMTLGGEIEKMLPGRRPQGNL